MNAERLLQHFDRVAEAPNAIAHLRRFILDLAVRGKLVDQDPNDEPASELIKQIQEEKEKLLQTSVIKKIERFEQSKLTDLQFTAPTGWQVLPMSWLARKLGAGSTPLGGKSVYQNEGIPFLRSQNVHNDGLKLDDVALIPESVHNRMSGTHIKENDILLNITGASIGRCSLVPNSFKEGNVSQHVAIIRFFIPEMREFIHLSLISPFFQKLIDNVQVGVSREGLSMQSLKLFPMLIPPLAEQHRIVAKVDELMGLCDRLESAQQIRESQRDRLVAASLHHLNQSADGDRARFYFNHLSELTVRSEHIKELRQTILNWAVRGKLISQDPNDEPASELLERIQVEKLKSEKAGLLKKDKSIWEGLPKEAPYNLPLGWAWARIQDIFEISRGGSPRPAGDPRYFGGTIPWITVREITKDNEKYLFKTDTGLTEEGSTRSRFINPGDLLLTNSGATLGVPKISKIRGCMNDGVAVLRLFHTENVNDFAFLYLNSQTQAFRQINQGMGQPNLNTPIIAGWFFPLPPLAEQHRIVAKVDELMGLCERLETQLSTTQINSRQLLESLLHEALTPSM
jgi:type I restriction enzyme, S subunit